MSGFYVIPVDGVDGVARSIFGGATNEALAGAIAHCLRKASVVEPERVHFEVRPAEPEPDQRPPCPFPASECMSNVCASCDVSDVPEPAR